MVTPIKSAPRQGAPGHQLGNSAGATITSSMWGAAFCTAALAAALVPHGSCSRFSAGRDVSIWSFVGRASRLLPPRSKLVSWVQPVKAAGRRRRRLPRRSR